MLYLDFLDERGRPIGTSPRFPQQNRYLGFPFVRNSELPDNVLPALKFGALKAVYPKRNTTDHSHTLIFQHILVCPKEIVRFVRLAQASRKRCIIRSDIDSILCKRVL